MKKYNVFNLYIVKEDDYYFICEKGIKEHTYIEIFTHKTLKYPNMHYVKPLSEYYSLLAVMNYTTGKPLILTKKELLIKYAEINSPYIERKKQHRSRNYTARIKEQEEYIKALEQLAKESPDKAKELAIESLKRTGILDEKGDVAYPYNASLGNDAAPCKENKNIRTLKK